MLNDTSRVRGKLLQGKPADQVADYLRGSKKLMALATGGKLTVEVLIYDYSYADLAADEDDSDIVI